MQCPRCRHDNETGAKFCEECAAPLARICTNCGRQLSSTAKFCPECAHPAGAPASTQPRFCSLKAYTPKHLAEKILTSKAAVEGERKQVTVLFADLKGSMELLADCDPEEARKLLDPVLECMMEAVHHYEGMVNQVMGDGIMALFGAPIGHEDHAVRGCYAALRMQRRINLYADEVQRAGGTPVQIRVGLNSGEVVVRSIGSDLHMDYTAVGQTTHLAARMEQMAKPGSALVTCDTLKLAEGYVQVRPLGAVPVKGIDTRTPVYELTGIAAARSRLQASAGRGLTRFVGREQELHQLAQALDRAAAGHGQTVAVVGEAGMGKSRLAWEFARSHRTHGWLVLESSSVSYGKATPYLPVIELLKAYCRLQERDDPRAIRERVAGKLLTLDRALEPLLTPLLALLDVPVDDATWNALDPSQRRRRTLDAVKRLLFRESQVQPLLVIFEDLHWIDSETQALLDGLIESLPTARVLLLVNYRPEYEHTWNRKTYYLQLRIDPLPSESAEELLHALLGEDRTLEPLKRVLIERTEGNPFFLEESVQSLVEIKVLVGERGAYRMTKVPGAWQIPATVQAILVARIDRLSAEDKQLLLMASVIGKDVPFVLLEAIADVTGDDLRHALSRLQTAEFLYEARLFPDLEYTFKHALTHDVAYGSLLEDRRRALHAAVVQAIERLHADRLSEVVDVLAHHAVQGRLGPKAVRYLRQAGQKAVARSANQEAIRLFETALDLLAEMPESAESLSDILDIRIALGPSLIAVHGTQAEEVRTSYERALELVERLGDVSRRFPALWGLWYVANYRGRYQQAYEYAQRLLSAAQAGDDTGRLLEAHHSLWATTSAMGQPADSITHAELGIALYDRDRHASQTFLYGGHDPGTCCRWHLAMNRWLLGYPDQALAATRDAFRLAEQLGHPMSTAITLWTMAWVHYQRGEREAAAETAEQLQPLAESYGFKGWLQPGIIMPHTRPTVRLDAVALAETRQRLLDARSAAWRHIFCMCVFAEVCIDVGHPEEGLRALETLEAADRNAFCGPEVFRIEGELLLRSAGVGSEGAEARFRTAIELAGRRAEKSLELRAATSLARLWRRQGKKKEAQRLLADVYGWFTEGQETRDLIAAKALLEELKT
jgi:class 3 adenylate cyclase/tetratricopeptide (TPR) repeat protein